MRYRSSLATENFCNPSSEKLKTLIDRQHLRAYVYCSDVKLPKLFKNLQIRITQRNLTIRDEDQSKVLRIAYFF
jgi:hypothetical protein